MRLMRDQQTVTVGTSSVQIAGPNTQRKGLIVGAPPPAPSGNNNATVAATGVGTAAIGVKQSYVCPVGKTATLTFATAQIDAGTPPTVALQAIIGGVTVTLALGAVPQSFTGRVPLRAGDTAQWSVTVLGAGSTCDFVLGIEEEVLPVRITLSFNNPAVIDQGLTIYAGTLPMILTDEWAAEALKEGIAAVASQAGVQITIIDIFGH